MSKPPADARLPDVYTLHYSFKQSYKKWWRTQWQDRLSLV